MRRDVSLMATALLVAAPLMASSALAGEQIASLDARERAPALALVVFQDVPGGAEILSGNYEDGLDQANSALAKRPYRNKLEMRTNICAAQLKLGQLESANESCETALATSPPASSALAPRQFLAVAHVNHGVVHFVQGDHEFAAQEFRRAKAMYPSLRVAASNFDLTQPSLRTPRIEVGETL